MAETMVVNAQKLMELASLRKLNELVSVIVPDMVRVELLESDEISACNALIWIRDNGVMVSSTKAYEEYWSPSMDGNRDAKLGENARRAIAEVKERYKCQ